MSQNQVTLPIQGLKTIAWAEGYRSPTTPQYIDIVGKEIQVVSEDEAVRLIGEGEAVVMTFLVQYPTAPGLGIRAGRPNKVSSTIENGLMLVFGQEVAVRGDRPSYVPVDKLPLQAHECYHIIKAHWLPAA